MKPDLDGLQGKLTEMASEFRKRNDWVLVTNYDSVAGDAEVIVEWPQGAKRQSFDELYQELEKVFGTVRRADGKEVIFPQGIRVFAMNAEGQITLSPIKGLIKNYTTKRIVEITSRLGSVKLTSDHSVMGFQNEQIVPLKPEDAQWICTPQFYPSFNGTKQVDLGKENLFSSKVRNKNGTLMLYRSPIVQDAIVDEELMTFLGLWIADGCYHKSKGGVGIHISSYEDRKCAQIIDNVLKRFGSKGPTVVDDGVTAIVQSATLYNLMHYLGFSGNSHTKRIPAFIFGLKSELIAAFLKGYFSGDGTVSKGDINATTYSPNLRKDIQTLLLFFGIKSHVRTELSGGFNKTGASGFKISINCSFHKKMFAEKIGFLQEYKMNKIYFSPIDKSTSFVPLKQETMMALRTKVAKKQFRDALLIKKNKGKLTKSMLKRILSEAEKDDFVKNLEYILDMQVEFDLNKKSKTVSEGVETIVYDIETAEGNFIANNIVLKNSDGLSAGGIMSQVMARENKSFQTLVLKQLYPEHAEQIQKMGSNYFFCDFGSGQLDFLREAFGENFFVLDHHQPKDIAHALHANPLLFGFNGGTEISAAGMAYLFAKAVNPKNADLAALAIVGAMGDMQDSGGKLIGLNAQIASEGISARVLDRKTDLRLYGRISRPLIPFLMFSTNPVLPELTGNEENCREFLAQIGIPIQNGDAYRSFEDLTSQERKKLVTELILHLDSHGVPEWKIRELIGEVYTLTRENEKSPLRDAKEFSTVLNAVGRHNRSEIGLAVCQGDRADAYAEALSLLQKHRRELREGIEFMLSKGVEERKWFYFFDAENSISDSIVGIVAGMLYGSGTIGFDKPIIAFSRYENGDIKASGRATKELVRRGLNLGHGFREICAVLGPGNEGGGHAVAAGVKIKLEARNRFLELLDQKIEEQLTGEK